VGTVEAEGPNTGVDQLGLRKHADCYGCRVITDDYVDVVQERFEKPHTGPATHLQRDRALGGIQIEVRQAPLRIRPIMGKWTAVARHVPGWRLDLDDQRPTLRQQFAAKRASDLVGKLKDADTGER
jgi:hypothetical protein